MVPWLICTRRELRTIQAWCLRPWTRSSPPLAREYPTQCRSNPQVNKSSVLVGSDIWISALWIWINLIPFYIFFGSKIAIYLSLSLHKGRPSDRRSLQPSKENIQHFKDEIFELFPIFWVYLLSWIQYGSGSITLIDSNGYVGQYPDSLENLDPD